MAELIELAVEKLRALPAETRDSLSRFVLDFDLDDTRVISLTADEEADLADADAEIARGELATDEEMRAIWAKHSR